MPNTHTEVPTAPTVTVPKPNNGSLQVTPEYTVLVLTLLVAGVKAAPSTINASARVFNALAHFIRELRSLIRIIQVSKKKPKSPDKK